MQDFAKEHGYKFEISFKKRRQYKAKLPKCKLKKPKPKKSLWKKLRSRIMPEKFIQKLTKPIFKRKKVVFFKPSGKRV